MRTTNWFLNLISIVFIELLVKYVSNIYVYKLLGEGEVKEEDRLFDIV
jgi:hypothetical protein